MMFEIIKQGYQKIISGPGYGFQDVGVTPGGPMDSFAFDTGNAILGNPDGTEALEILLAPSVRFTEPVFFVLAGAKHNDVILKNRIGNRPVKHGQVTFADDGNELFFGRKEYGFRSYLCMRSQKKCIGKSPEGLSLPPFSETAGWTDKRGRIRVLEGPEYRYLDKKNEFTDGYWVVSNDTSEMGMWLNKRERGIRAEMPAGMVSEAVSNGTVQLTPDGPVVLLKHRQTVGGYPRIYNVITADVDMLAQYIPGNIIRFRKATMAEAHESLRLQKNEIEKIRAMSSALKR